MKMDRILLKMSGEALAGDKKLLERKNLRQHGQS